MEKVGLTTKKVGNIAGFIASLIQILPLHILKVSSGLIIGSSSYLATASTWSCAGCVAISFSCPPSNPDPIPTASIRTPRSRISRDGTAMSSIDDAVARTRRSWGILLRPLFLNQLVFTPVRLDPAMSNKEYIEIKFQIIVHIYFFFHVMGRLSVKYSHEFGIFRYINVV